MMNYTKPEMKITSFSKENIVTVSVTDTTAVFEAAEVTDVTITDAINVQRTFGFN